MKVDLTLLKSEESLTKEVLKIKKVKQENDITNLFSAIKQEVSRLEKNESQMKAFYNGCKQFCEDVETAFNKYKKLSDKQTEALLNILYGLARCY